MVFIILSIFLCVARFCPDTVIGRWLDGWLFAPVTRWFAALTWRRALIGLAVAAVTVGLLMLGPEMALLAAGVDVTLVVELALLAGLNATRIRWAAMVSRIRAIGAGLAGRLVARRAARAVRSFTRRRPGGSGKRDDDAAGRGLTSIIREVYVPA